MQINPNYLHKDKAQGQQGKDKRHISNVITPSEFGFCATPVVAFVQAPMCVWGSSLMTALRNSESSGGTACPLPLSCSWREEDRGLALTGEREQLPRLGGELGGQAA